MMTIETRDRATGAVERLANHEMWIGQRDVDGRKIFTGDIVEMRDAMGRAIGRFRVEYYEREGRFVLKGVTPGANLSRITVRQKVKVIGR